MIIGKSTIVTSITKNVGTYLMFSTARTIISIEKTNKMCFKSHPKSHKADIKHIYNCLFYNIARLIFFLKCRKFLETLNPILGIVI